MEKEEKQGDDDCGGRGRLTRIVEAFHNGCG